MARSSSASRLPTNSQFWESDDELFDFSTLSFTPQPAPEQWAARDTTITAFDDVQPSVPAGGDSDLISSPLTVEPQSASDFVPETFLLEEPSTPAISGSFNAITYDQSFFIPPDPIGAAGLNHLVNVVNVQVQWFTKAGVNQNTQSLQSFFGSPTSTFDPKVIYDHHRDRFLLMTLEQAGRNDANASNDVSRIYLAISDDADPNGTWHKYSFDSLITVGGANYWADYPGFAEDEQAIYITANYFSFETGVFFGSRLWIIPKTDSAYNGTGIAASIYDPSTAAGVGSQLFTLQPAHVMGDINGATTGTYLISTDVDFVGPQEGAAIIRVDNPTTTPTFTNTSINAGDISAGAPPDAPQLGGATPINTGGNLAYQAVWWNNHLYATTTINVGGQATAHWFDFNANGTAAPTLAQQGNILGEDIATGTYTFFPSVAVNSQGTLAFGFAASGPSIYGGSYYTIHAATDAAGTVQNSQVLRAGQDSYVQLDGSGRNRWGDYSGMALDPADDMSFWVYNEHAIAKGDTTGKWGTAWGNIVLGHFAAPTFELAAFGVNAGNWTSNDLYPRQLADVNADGRADIVGFGQAGVWESLATAGGHFAMPTFELAAFGVNAGDWTSDDLYPRKLADVNADGRADIVGFGNAGVWVSLATAGGHFAAPTFELAAFGVNAGGWTSEDLYPREVADVNGDGMADIVGFGQAGVWESLATAGGHFAMPTFELAAFGVNAGDWTSDVLYPRQLADVNADGRADIVGFGNAGVWVSLATAGGHFAAPTFELAAFGVNAGVWTSHDLYPRQLADVNGDGIAEIVGFGNAGVWESLATAGGHFAAPTFELAAFGVNAGDWTSDGLYPRELADVTGEGQADIVGFSQAGVFLSQSFFVV
jgi:hypothetical protein